MRSVSVSNSASILTSLGKWGILSVRIPGYFPFTLSSSPSSPLKTNPSQEVQAKRFSFTLQSAPSLYTVSILILFSAWNFLFFLRKSAFNKYLKARGNTELYAYSLMIAVDSLMALYIMAFGLKNPSNFFQFWKRNCTLLDQIQTELSFSFEPSENNLGILGGFYKIEKSIQFSFFTLILPLVLHVVVAFGYRIIDSFLHTDGSIEDTELAFGLGFWTFFSLSGSGISIWMLFFIQFYTVCLNAVWERLQYGRGRAPPSRALEFQSDRNLLSQFYADDEMYSRVILNRRALGSDKPLNSAEMGKEKNSESETEAGLEKKLAAFQAVLQMIEEFNKFFGIILIFKMSVCVLNLLVNLFFGLAWMGRGEFGLLLETFVPIYINGKELYDLGSGAEEMTAAAVNVVRTFSEKLKLETFSGHMHLKVKEIEKQEEIQEHIGFQLQMIFTQVLSNPPAISAKQFFFINRSLVTAVLSGLATFLVVLVQFKDADAN